MTIIKRFLLPALLLLGACAETKYIGYDKGPDEPGFPFRTVAFEISK